MTPLHHLEPDFNSIPDPPVRPTGELIVEGESEPRTRHVCDMCGINLDSNVSMHNVGGGRSYCMQCHTQEHAQMDDSIQRRISKHRESVGHPMSDSDLEKIRLGEKKGREKVAIRNNSEAYVNKRLNSIGVDTDMGKNKGDEQQIEYIPLGECADGRVYRIRARNGRIGVFNKVDSSFTLSRHKFGENFLFDEFHWDTGEPFGTVKPLEDLGEALVPGTDQEYLDYLNNLTKSVPGVEYPEFEELKKKLNIKDD